MSKSLLLATRNQHKKAELQAMLKDMGIKVLGLDDLAGMPEVEENGRTFEENAVKKARENALVSKMVCLADDSGLVVDALDGKPGVFSARFAGPKASDLENNIQLLKMMEGVKETHRTARFECVIAVCSPDLNVKLAKGTCEGTIALQPRGNAGFGYDPLFIPKGYSISFAEMAPEDKNRISHRGIALRKALPIIKGYFYGHDA
ncbi:MAG: XTP/dITP diphosphatase [Syntrophomonadaceae bacterium]